MVEWTAHELAVIERLRGQFDKTARALSHLSHDADMHYDRDGHPIDMAEWCVLFERRNYRIVERALFPDLYELSTIWLGLDHAFPLDGVPHVPLIFESMVFAPRPHYYRGHKVSDRTSEEEAEHGFARWSTIEQAREGHAAMVRELAKEHGVPVAYTATP